MSRKAVTLCEVLRRSMGATQQHLALAAGVHKTTVAYLEQGYPSSDRSLALIAAALKWDGVPAALRLEVVSDGRSLRFSDPRGGDGR